MRKKNWKWRVGSWFYFYLFNYLLYCFLCIKRKFCPLFVSLVINLICSLSTIISLLLQHLPASWACPTICSTECTALYLVLLTYQHVQKWNCHSTNKIWLTTYFCWKHYHSFILNITFNFTVSLIITNLLPCLNYISQYLWHLSLPQSLFYHDFCTVQSAVTSYLDYYTGLITS